MTPDEKQKKHISKLMSLVLRHQPEVLGLSLDAQGWVATAALLAGLQTRFPHITLADLHEIVASNDKQRYAFNEDATMIRANQGHSVDISPDYTPLEPPQLLYHGTATHWWESIREQGILKQSRLYVHLSSDVDTAHKVGMRHGKPFIIHVLAGEMYAQGYTFYRADNGVWLTEYVPPQFLSEAP